MWTLDELVERVREALTAEYRGAPNGRVRELPDRRAIRWYTTIGLVDKPLGMRGRTALYGPRHLEQIVAIKRRQAEGRSLSQIQAEFMALPAGDLSEIARLPARTHFWADRPAPGRPAALPAALPAASSEPLGSMTGVVLDGGVVVLVPGEVADSDRADIAAAAAPLLDLLSTRGLIDRSSS